MEWSTYYPGHVILVTVFGSTGATWTSFASTHLEKPFNKGEKAIVTPGSEWADTTRWVPWTLKIATSCGWRSPAVPASPSEKLVLASFGMSRASYDSYVYMVLAGV
ncbi:hypothetical protein FRC04_011881 [Tulasnella sp. 424]|nr:hypothetical protein FRC04_011881 [Tulasnella sp. 424]